MTAVPSLANYLYLAAAAPARGRFERALRDPGRAQRGILRRILRRNASTVFGRAHGFGHVHSVRDYRDRVPIRDYNGYADLIERVGRGESGVLTADVVRFVEPSGGSFGPSKYIPFTRSLLREFSAAAMPWIFDLLRHRPRLRTGRAYWAISPPARPDVRTPGGLPVGAEHDSDYFPPFVRSLLDRSLGVPRSISRVPDVGSCRYLTLLALLGMPDLALISVWSPTFLLLLADALDEHFGALLRDLETGELSVRLPADVRAAVARSLPARPRLARALRWRFGTAPPRDLGALWQQLALISCWADGHAARALTGLRGRFPTVEVQGKGLLATEGVVSIPLFDAGAPVAAVASHFLEFLPEGSADVPSLVDELEQGATYEVVLTTGGGLYRYRLKDRVRVEGHHYKTPLLSFVGRADRASDLAGEKLTPELVEAVMSSAAEQSGIHPTFAMLAPVWGTPPSYHLYVDAPTADAARLAEVVERFLMEAHHYALCRALGQLGPVCGVAVLHAHRVYEQVCAARGQRVGAIKPTPLEPDLGWGGAFLAAEHSAERSRPAQSATAPC